MAACQAGEIALLWIWSILNEPEGHGSYHRLTSQAQEMRRMSHCHIFTCDTVICGIVICDTVICDILICDIVICACANNWNSPKQKGLLSQSLCWIKCKRYSNPKHDDDGDVDDDGDDDVGDNGFQVKCSAELWLLLGKCEQREVLFVCFLPLTMIMMMMVTMMIMMIIIITMMMMVVGIFI